jgi:hypothetical protein
MYTELLKDNPRLFDIFVARQEYTNKKDRFGRFLYKFSNYKDVLRPLVSEYLKDKGFCIEWPEEHKFAACLTHDVDSIVPSWKYTIYTTIKTSLNLNFSRAWERLASKIKKTNLGNPYLNFRQIIELEAKYEAKSSFYFLTTSKDPYNWTYDVEDIKYELQNIVDSGCEVGLHGGYFSYNDPKALKYEKNYLEKVLGRKVIGVRMHWLRFDVPDTWNILSDLGFEYDTTFGFPDMPGFRNGMCYCFKPYDLRKKKIIDIVEIPLHIMDATLFKRDLVDSWKLIKKIIDEVEKNSGVLTLLWHNTTFDEIFWGDWAKLYERILRELKERNAWMTTAENIYNHWKKVVSDWEHS